VIQRQDDFRICEVWTRVPRTQLGSAPTKKERESILGYGKKGV
jgi:hypothetical protein